MSKSISYTGRQAIKTQYFGPGNVRGSRIKATCDAGSITVDYDHALNVTDNHVAACEALLKRLGWSQPYSGGAFKDGSMFWVAEPGANGGAGYGYAAGVRE